MSSSQYFQTPDCYAKQIEQTIPVSVLAAGNLHDWLNTQTQATIDYCHLRGFKAKAGQVLFFYNSDGQLDHVVGGLDDEPSIYNFSSIAEAIRKELADDKLKATVFSFNEELLNEDSFDKAALGWGLGCYRFEHYKTEKTYYPKLALPSLSDATRVQAQLEAISYLRNLVNMPANELGPAELEDAASELATLHKAKIKVVKGRNLEKNFPMVHVVGQAATKDRAPRLIEIKAGSKDHPKLTLVGKGVCFDTGGLDLKPSQYMRHMKKDMGGAAHALALAHIVMSLKLPVQLRVLVPAVENSVSGAAFRAGDIIKSRSGITIENTNTDAEGRLILSDTLTYASEDEPDLIVDFATLTGSARAALGQDIPAGFSNDETLAAKIRDITFAVEDGVWPMPLHKNYYRLLKSDVADTINSAEGTPGDLIYSALFLQKFLGDTPPNWIHIDCFAWESSGRPGRSKGGKDTGLRGIFAVLEDLYGS